MKNLIPILCLALASCSENTAEVIISPQLPEGVRADFLARIETTTLMNAIDHAGQPVQVKAGAHSINIPCDGVSENNVAKVKFQLKPNEVTRMIFNSCGVSFLSNQSK